MSAAVTAPPPLVWLDPTLNTLNTRQALISSPHYVIEEGVVGVAGGNASSTPGGLNMSGVGEVNGDSHYSLAEKVAIGVILGALIFCSIAGNILVIIAILTERSLRKASNYFYVSLAVADLLVATGVMTFAVANDILGYWVFGPAYCNIWLSSDVMCSTASILNLCAISLDRYLHIRAPYTYDRLMSPRRTLLCIAAVWSLSALISFLPIQLGWHRTADHSPYAGDRFICLLDLNQVYAVVSSIVSFFTPCVIMIAIYVQLFRLARRHVASIKRQTVTPPIGSTNGDNLNGLAGGGPGDASPPDGGGYRPGSSQYKPSDHKAAVTLGVIMGTFLFCWVPFFTINIVTAFCSGCIPPLVFVICTWVGYLNSMANPVIYPIFNKEFRVAFQRLLRLPRPPAPCCLPRGHNAAALAAAAYKHKQYGVKASPGVGGPRSNGAAGAACCRAEVEYGALAGTGGGSRKSSASPLIRDHVTCL